MALDTTISGATADSYATLAEYQAYGAALGWTLSGVDATDEQHLRRAAQVLDRQFSWPGYPTVDGQALQHPRFTTIIVDGRELRSDEVHQRLKDAQCELAYLIQGGLDPAKTISGDVKVAGAGPARVEFFGAPGVPRMVAIEGLIAPLLGSTGRGLNMARG